MSHRFAVAILLAGAVGACGSPVAGGPPAEITSLPRQLSAAERSIAEATPTFAVNLLRAVNTSFADSNVFISPLSASMALGMTLNGAAGVTYTEMRDALGLADRALAELNAGYSSLIALLRSLDRTVDFRIANSIWYDQPYASVIEAAFLNDTRQYFGATVSPLDFRSPQAVTAINSWVNTGTNGKITKIIDAIPPQMVMYLINAIYFKGSWRNSFDPAETANGDFTTHRGERVTARLMTRDGGFRLGSSGGATVAELPYGGDAFVMTVVLPPQGTSINDFVASLSVSSFQALTSNLVPSTHLLFLPKFRMEWEDTLNDELQTLGMRQAFVSGRADFSGISRTLGTQLSISEVKQKTFVDVNEEGTEAAAATSVGIGVTSGPPSVRINRPFVFAIRERLSGTILFIGKIVRPVAPTN
ncbi:MAG: serpin family protein [Gemmatimonadota bacterium]